MVKEIYGSYQVQYHPHGKDQTPVVIDFTPPFRVYLLISEMCWLTESFRSANSDASGLKRASRDRNFRRSELGRFVVAWLLRVC